MQRKYQELDYYKFKVHGDKGDIGCKELKEISHVAHIEHATSILKSNQIKTSLVYDHSILNKDRILVCWLSPNNWPGYIYGSVKFRFKAEDIISKFKYVYWVEKIESYNPTACRILFTNNDYSSFSKLTYYDIVEKDGPIWFDFETKKFYWNSCITLELMFEDSIKLNDCRIGFVSHHSELCNLKNKLCREKKIASNEVKALFLANIISNHVRLTGFNYKIVGSKDFITIGKERILNQFSNEQCKGELTFEHESAKAVAYSFLTNYGKGYKSIATKLFYLFKSKEELRKCINYLILRIIFGEEKIPTMEGKKNFITLPIFIKHDKITSGIFIGIDRVNYATNIFDRYTKVDKFTSIAELDILIEQSSNCNMYMIRNELKKLSEIVDSIKKANKKRIR